MRNYDKPLTFILTGSGISKPENSRTLLEDFIFGNLPGDAVVDVKFVVPYFDKISPSLNAAIEILKEWGIDGDDFIPVVEPNSGHKSLVTATKTEQVDKGDAEQYAIDLLSQARSDGRDVFYISIYDPARDISSVTAAKDWTWLPSLNLAEGLIDSFDGYESEEDRLKREELQNKFDEEQKAKEAAEKSVKEPAKEATTPRKRAVKKRVAVEDVPLTEDAVKAPTAPQMATGWGPHEHKFVWADDGMGNEGSICSCGEIDPAEILTGTAQLVHDAIKPKPAAGLIADAVKREAEKKAARTQYAVGDKVTVGGIEFTKIAEPSTELSGTISMSSLPKDLEPAKLIDPTPDVWKDVAEAVPAIPDSVTVSKSDIVQLGDAMQKMAEGFSDAIAVYKKIVENN